jgi:hypothetical protein
LVPEWKIHQNGGCPIKTEIEKIKNLLRIETASKSITSVCAELWLKNGIKHRDFGPAVVFNNGELNWYINGELHREDGPAVVHPNKSKVIWYKNGNVHRDDGPAIIYQTGQCEWWTNGKITKTDWISNPIL